MWNCCCCGKDFEYSEMEDFGVCPYCGSYGSVICLEPDEEESEE